MDESSFEYNSELDDLTNKGYVDFDDDNRIEVESI
jgi:hypothetical protein